MNRHVVTLNAGSSSIKFALFELDGGDPPAVAIGLVEMAGKQRHIKVHKRGGTPIHEDTWCDGEAFHTEALRRVLAWRLEAFPGANVVAAGHRVVHGGVASR
jgi:acetate kinase